jgi:hypothetical protein
VLLQPVLAGFAGLTLDGGRIYFERRHIQSIADAAALTGAQKANFNSQSPAIESAAIDQARSNALTNGAQAAEVTVNLPPSSGPYLGNPQYIEVIVTRSVRNSFMGLFGMHTSTIQARAVARCIKPGYGNPAVLGLDYDDPDTIRFNGGGSSGVEIVGDVVSHGGLNPNGDANHFQIEGTAYALNGEAADVTATNGSYGTDSGVALLDVGDPIEHGMAAGHLSWPTWPTSNGSASITDSDGETSTDTGNVTVQNNEEAVFHPGVYNTIRLQGGDSIFEPGVYVVETLDFGAGSSAIGEGVIFKITSSISSAVDVGGGAEFTFTAVPGNTWQNIVFYLPDGGVDLQGNGHREIQGSIYAPNGTVAISGNGTEAVVYGQVIAWHVEFSGNGPTVIFDDPGNAGTFGPVLVNTPEP